jgi:hypothetical protein
MEEEYRRLMARILKAVPGLTIEGLEALVNEKVKTHPYLNKVGAILLVAEELNVLESREEVPEEVLEELAYARIGDLVPGLSNVYVRGVVYAVIGPRAAGEHRLLRLKIGDRSGVTEVYAWNEKIDEISKLSIKIGDNIAIINAYTKEKIETGAVEVHLGRNSVVKKLPQDSTQPEPHSFYKTLTQVMEEGDGVYDIRGYLMSISEEKKLLTRYGEASIIEITLSDGSSLAKLTVWRGMVDQFKNLSPGMEIFITDVRLEDNRFYLTSRSTLSMIHEAGLEKIKEIKEKLGEKKIARIIDIEALPNYTIITATDGVKIFQLTCREELDLKPGEYVEVYGIVDDMWTPRRMIMIDKETLKKIENPTIDISIPSRLISLKEIAEKKTPTGEDVIVEGILYTKTNIVNVETRYGIAEKILFWLKDEDIAVQGVAWRSKAQEVSIIPEGARIRIKWVNIKQNIFGEPEIHLNSYSKIEAL